MFKGFSFFKKQAERLKTNNSFYTVGTLFPALIRIKLIHRVAGSFAQLVANG